MTTPYSPATATALTMGATDRGYVEDSSYVGSPAGGPGWDISASRYNNQAIEERLSRLLLDLTDNVTTLRRQLLASTSTVKILAAGDSITVGFGSTNGRGWPGWLADFLRRRRIEPTITTCGHGGWWQADLATALPAALAAATPDIVLINIGTNDQVASSYQDAYGQMIDQILASSPTVKVACALIPISQPASIQASEARANTAVQAAVAARANTGRVLLSDHRSTTSARWVRDATDGSAPRSGRWTLDGVHPLDAGYLQMAEQWLTTIQPWLPQQ